MLLYLLSLLYILMDSYFVQSAVSHLFLNQWRCLKLYLPFPVCLNCHCVFWIVVLFFRFVVVFSDLLFCFRIWHCVFWLVIMFSELLLCFLIFVFFFFRFAFAFVICYFVFRIGICFALLGHRGLQSANHLVQFGTSERRAQIIWLWSGLQSANHLVQFGTSEHRAHVCVCIYIVYEISKWSNMFTKTCFKIYLDKDIFCQYIFWYLFAIVFK